MRTNSKTVRTCGLMPQSFRSPPLAVNWRRQDKMAPIPELSTKRNRARSSTSSECACRTGARSRLNSVTLLASSSSTGTSATATSPNCSIARSMRTSRVLLVFNQRHAASAEIIPVIPHLVDAPGNDVGAEAGLARTVERGRRNRGRIERITAVVQLDGDMPRESFSFQLNPLVVAPMIGVFHDVHGGFMDGQFQRADAFWP